MADDRPGPDTTPISIEEVADVYVTSGHPERALPLLRRILAAQPHRVDLEDRVLALEHAVLTHQRRTRTREMPPEVLAEAFELMDLPERAIEAIEALIEARPGDPRLRAWADRLRIRVERSQEQEAGD